MRQTLLTIALFATAFFVGCQVLPEPSADPTTNYVLTGPELKAGASLTPSGTMQVGLRPVEIPDFLRRSRGIVVREGLNRVRTQDLARWAEPLESGINRVLRERLLETPEIAGVYLHPFSTQVKRDSDITVRILRCEGVLTDEGGYVARFAAAYEVISTDGSNRVLARKIFAAPDQPWDGKDFGVLVRLLSDGVNALCAEIAKDVRD
ncbi:membrane integrity-associated transporter subunit PqiC [Nibricoccus sp. IMCC34717]|uniref:PqiC family protein n=1 Tax=Nibricoccus sp. IMCC34717 TaxID=3034021 RepID=UPI0038508823